MWFFWRAGKAVCCLWLCWGKQGAVVNSYPWTVLFTLINLCSPT